MPQGHPNAQYNLGTCYAKGRGVRLGVDVRANPRFAAKAMTVTCCVAFAQVSTWDECWEKAVYWFTLAAEQGDAAAQCNLATCYLKGQGVEQNRPEAIRWYEQAAQRCAHDVGRWWRSQRCLKRVVRGAGAMRRRAGTWRHCWADGLSRDVAAEQ